MRKNAAFPAHLCIKTGAPAISQRTEKLKWVPAWVNTTLLAGRAVHYAVAESHGREFNFRYGVSRAALLQRYLPLIGGYSVAAVGFLCFVGTFVWMFTLHQEGDPIPTSGFLFGGILLAAGALVAHFTSKLLTAVAMDDNFVVIRGVSSKLLAVLPEWPGPVPQGTSK
ncbi:hypothetical protein ETAA8_49050 [Anatilimnocola aggregata]|uniref:Uncharacterized protein n=1 Tax=Anatilimnocola aggregata TaxID=2528021 RepID=A0A517YHS5_9BACT|nr:hypothetical protein [Anatilimnocola aggregata]QDU29790.1 hypothetical protein ETAA8_49050 [Anatilimnocola aggregata]